MLEHTNGLLPIGRPEAWTTRDGRLMNQSRKMVSNVLIYGKYISTNGMIMIVMLDLISFARFIYDNVCAVMVDHFIANESMC